MQVELRTALSIAEQNQPGILSEITSLFREEDVNLQGLSAPSHQHGKVFFLVDDPADALILMDESGYNVLQEEVLVVQLDNYPGSVSEVFGPLSDHRINVTTAFATSKGEKSFLILQTSSNRQALEVLQKME